MTKKTITPKDEPKVQAKAPTKGRTASEQTILEFDLPPSEKTCKKSTCCSNKSKSTGTRIVIHYNVGFGNNVYVRGKGANLSWDTGILLKNIKNDEWIWETDLEFPSIEFKVLINDAQYESGENHHLTCGTTIQYTPKF